MIGLPIIVVIVVVGLLLYTLTAAGDNVPKRLSYEEILPYAQRAGFSGDDLYTAVAIALAESSGETNAYNPETQAGAAEGKGSYGLWQIYLTAHPEFSGVNLNDPQLNANAAFLVYTRANNRFTPWSTYNNGAYQAYLPAEG
jgi:hypothetical protein